MSDLEFGRRAARSGTARSVMVFLHGYGADGSDLLGLADVLAPHLPDTVFVAPDAPEPCVGNPFGRQWFPIPWLDGSSQAAADVGLASSSDLLNGFLDARLAEEGLGPERMALFGFSQGAMMAMHVTPRRAQAVACVVACSGRLLVPERLAVEMRVRPPMLLMHGDEDQVVPFADMARAGQGLGKAGIPVAGHVMNGTAHGIAPDGLSAALGFVIGHLPDGA